VCLTFGGEKSVLSVYGRATGLIHAEFRVCMISNSLNLPTVPNPGISGPSDDHSSKKFLELELCQTGLYFSLQCDLVWAAFFFLPLQYTSRISIFFIVFSILQEMKRISYKIQRSPFRYSIEILLLQASDHIATSYAELRDGSANAKV
jgi:hypothetical protein